MRERSAPMWWALAALVVAALLIVPLVVGDDDEGAAGFDGYIQNGTCATPSDELVVDLQGADGAHDVEPYVAVGGDGEPVTLGHYGAPGLPGFSVAAIYTDHQFSMVITDPDSDEAVACGDILRPDADQFGEAGVAVVQLLPVGSSGVEGVATLERARLQRELDITPTRARILLSTEAVTVPSEAAAGYDGYVQSGTCELPLDDVRVESDGGDDYDLAPFQALSAEAAAPVTVAYYGSAGAGFGVSAASTDQDFSVVIADPDSGQAVACGDILEPNAVEFTEAGQALVQLLPSGDAGVQGFAVLDRVTMQRELDVTPTLIRYVLFAPPASDT
jgi:hypothetical protein